VTAYLDGLKMLGRRELSEAQVRQRLERKGHPPEAIDAAVERLRLERALDDGRVADAIARVQVSLRGRGKPRVLQAIQAAGVPAATARQAVDRAFADVDMEALLESSLAKRLKGRSRLAGEAELARLYRYLVRQGFEPDRVLAALNRRTRHSH
jgi:regulatory protein